MSSSFALAVTLKKNLASVLLILAFVCPQVGSAADDGARSWVRGFAGGFGTGESRFEPFTMQTVRSENGHLTGTCGYEDYRDESKSKLPYTIEGRVTADGRFWPRVEAEVASDPNGAWQKIPRPPDQGEAATFTLERNSRNILFYVDLDVFRPLIGKVRYGRLALQNGETALFVLENLLPPTDPSTSSPSIGSKRKWSRELVYGYIPDPLVMKPFILGAVESTGGRLLGLGGYASPEGASSTVIRGTEAPDGTFRPYVVAQVANDQRGVWKTLPAAVHQGDPKTLTIRPNETSTAIRVELDVFIPMIGKFRYGRVVLQNEKSAAFELKDLLPPEDAIKGGK